MVTTFVTLFMGCSLLHASLGVNVQLRRGKTQISHDPLQLSSSQFNESVSQTLSMASHNITEWNQASRSFEVNLATNVTPICMDGHAIPQFYLLGTQRAGTTTMARDLMDVGVKSAKGYIKELHHFDAHCGFKTESLHAGDISVPLCNGMSAIEKSNWAQWFSESCVEQPPLADMTPVNLRIPGLPYVIKDLYAQHSKRIVFGILIREPLARLQSGWYHSYQLRFGRAPHIGAFQQSMNWVIPMARQKHQQDHQRQIEHETYGNIGRNYALDQLYRSMYSLTMYPWLKSFEASRFIIIPSGKYQSDHTFKKKVLLAIGDHLGSKLYTEGIKMGSVSTGPWHPSVDDDLDSKAQLTLRTEFFDPMTADLAGMLSMRVPHGLILTGFLAQYSNVTQHNVKQFLTEHW